MACGIGLGLAAAKALQDVMARAASLIPARRAASIDPLQALRRE
jgi:ABC-type lipoprotein release transport system permease subunit